VRVLERLDRDELSELRERDEFFWVDLESPSEEEVETLGDQLGLHPLAVEDTLRFGQRPKLDTYEDHALLVFYGAALGADERPEGLEVHCFLTGGYVVTVRRRHCPELDTLRSRLAEGAHGGEQWLVYRVLDAITDSFFPVLEAVDGRLDEMEDEVLARPSEDQLARIFALRRALSELRQVVGPQRDLFARAIDDILALPGLEPDTHDYFRSIYDHLIRVSETLDTYRDVLSTAADLYLSTVSNRLNDVMRRLTMIATIFLPLTFVTGFFGQNFDWLVESIDSFVAFLVFGMGGLVVPLTILFVYFRRRGFL
jgi:magnesium transporter